MGFWEFTWRSLVEAFDNTYELIIINALWLVFTVLVLTAPPAAAGLVYATNQLAHKKSASWRTFFEGFRKYIWTSYLWGISNIFVLVTFFLGIDFYGQFEVEWLLCIRGLFIGLLIPWVLLQVYTLPLLIEQDEQRLTLALRNSSVLYLRNPGFSIGLVFVLAILFYISYLLKGAPVFIFLGSLSAVLVNNNLLYMLKRTPKK
jgi:uncharacterized membrane protein YesL